MITINEEHRGSNVIDEAIEHHSNFASVTPSHRVRIEGWDICFYGFSFLFGSGILRWLFISS
jgi:hypothetical protein